MDVFNSAKAREAGIMQMPCAGRDGAGGGRGIEHVWGVLRVDGGEWEAVEMEAPACLPPCTGSIS